jgi:transcriptional regulator with AAA-type ATPase domain
VLAIAYAVTPVLHAQPKTPRPEREAPPDRRRGVTLSRESMTTSDETCDDSLREPLRASRPEPGVVVVLAAGNAATVALRVEAGGLEVGRATPPGFVADDDRVSRRHVRIARERDGWSVEDLGSRNGTFVGGRPLAAKEWFPSPALVRVGKTLIWAVDDIQPFAHEPASRRAAGLVAGGRLRRAYGDIALAARAGDTLFVRGESGSGKELAARAFHEARHGATSDAPFVAVNCAAIPEGLAERLLFGARKGSYSGATADAEGYVQAAHGGTLFLDEIAELDPLVQAKLLRVLETREVLPLGASKPRQVTMAVCAASHKPLRDEVTAGRFREDLYFRIARPEALLPALRERIDEIPVFVTHALRDVDANLTASVALVEACCLRPWPGNVRELQRELRRAAHVALHEGAQIVDVSHLSGEAGLPLSGDAASGDAPERPPSAARSWTDDDIRRALTDNAGNVRGTARSLGMHRNQLRRWLAKHPEAQAQPDPDGD